MNLIPSEKHGLEQLTVVSQMAVARSELPGFVRDHAKLDAVADVITGHLIFSLKSVVLAEKLAQEQQTVTLNIPASWWQHFKRDSWLGRHRPQWMRKRWPVRFTTMRQTVRLAHRPAFAHPLRPV